MPASRELDPAVTSPHRGATDKAAGLASWVVMAGLAVVPLVCAPGLEDRFRIVKESAARGEALILGVLVLASALFAGTGRLRELIRTRGLIGFVLAGLGWCGITTLTSTHRLLSVDSFVTVFTMVLLFLAASYIAPRAGLTGFDLLVPVAAFTTVLVTLQEYGIYNPFAVSEDVSLHLSATGTIGNPNIVGSYLALVTVVLAASAMQTKGFRCGWYSLGAVVALAGVFISRTETAVVAAAAGLVVLAARLSFRRFVALGGALVAIIVIGGLSGVPVARELINLPERIRAQGLEGTLSGRVAPALVAWQMVRDRPVFGFGPETYGFHFMPRRIQLTEQSHGTISVGLRTNFAEVHNDHLQLAAEAGVPGYLLFLAFIAFLTWKASAAPSDSIPGRLARALALPLAVTLLVLALGQFPLQVAVTRHLLVTVAGLIAGWSRS